MTLYLYHISPVEPVLLKIYEETDIHQCPKTVLKDAIQVSKEAHLKREEPYDFNPIVTYIEGAIGEKEATHLIQIGADVFVLAVTPRVVH